MSKRIRYPNGFIGIASDEVAAILAQRPGHVILTDRPPDPPRKPEPKTTKENSNG